MFMPPPAASRQHHHAKIDKCRIFYVPVRQSRNTVRYWSNAREEQAKT
jgi:hypothetical protein